MPGLWGRGVPGHRLLAPFRLPPLPAGGSLTQEGPSGCALRPAQLCRNWPSLGLSGWGGGQRRPGGRGSAPSLWALGLACTSLAGTGSKRKCRPCWSLRVWVWVWVGASLRHPSPRVWCILGGCRNMHCNQGQGERGLVEWGR